MNSNNKKIILGMSGGVDSSVAFLILKKMGYSPIGVSLKYATWCGAHGRENICCTRESFSIARKICAKFKAPHHILDVSREFKKLVVNYFIGEYKKYSIPNPCVICNQNLKFDSLLNFAKKNKITKIATGHYAKIIASQEGGLDLIKSRDKAKDQTYTLSKLTQKQLKNTIFPLGSYTKNEVYNMAKENGFSFFDKQKESADFCYVSGRDIGKFLKEKISKTKGEIVNENNEILGKHNGLQFYTIGQKRNLNLAVPIPYYVLSKDTKKNRLIVTSKKYNPKFYKREIILNNFHFINPARKKIKQTVSVKIRYSASPAKAQLILEKNSARLKLAKSVRDVNSGQFAVCYKGKICLGGGRIK